MWLFIQVLWQCSSCTAHRVLCECLFRSFGSAPVVQLIEVCVNVYSGPYGGTEPKNTGPIYRNGIKSMHRNAIKGMHRNAIKGMQMAVFTWFLVLFGESRCLSHKRSDHDCSHFVPSNVHEWSHDQAAMGGGSIKYSNFVTKNSRMGCALISDLKQKSTSFVLILI